MPGVAGIGRSVRHGRCYPGDVSWNLLPYSSGSGVRYRYAARIIDSSRCANLNAGNPATSNLDTSLNIDTAGQYLTGIELGNSSIFNASDNANITNLQVNAKGRQSSTPFVFSSWQTQLLAYERPTSSAITFFDLTDEIQFRASGKAGALYTCRPAIFSPFGPIP